MIIATRSPSHSGFNRTVEGLPVPHLRVAVACIWTLDVYGQRLELQCQQRYENAKKRCWGGAQDGTGLWERTLRIHVTGTCWAGPEHTSALLPLAQPRAAASNRYT